MPQAFLSRTALSLAVSLLAAAPAVHAAIYVDLRPAVTGLATAPGQAGKIETNSLQWGAGVGISSGPGPVQVSTPSLSEMVWTQQGDSTLPPLMAASLTGNVMPTTRFDLVGSAGASTGTSYLSIGTERSVITGVQQVSSGGTPSVSASLGYVSFAMTYDPAGLGKPGAPVTASYDRATGQASGPVSRSPQAVGSGLPAAPGLYMRLGSGGPGGQIAGEVTSTAYLNWINIDSYQFGVGLGYDPSSGMVSVPSISEVTITQQLDATLPIVFGNLLRGGVLGQVTLELVTLGAAGPVTTMQLALNQVRFSGLTVSTGGDLPIVSESLNFRSFSQTAWPLLPDGTRGTPTSMSYNIDTGVSGPGTLASNVAGFGTGNLSVTAVPEPQTWALMLVGMGALLSMARRRGVARA